LSLSLCSSSSELLLQLLTEGKNFIGEILLGNDFSLRHREDIDVDASELKLYERPEAAREIARYDEAGDYRPLKTAPNLRRGWLLQLKNKEEMALALEFFYPAALNLYEAWLQKKLETTSLRETLGRQSGMYRVTQKLSEEQAQLLINKTCNEGCLRKILWPMASDQKATAFFQEEERKIPLLCREACNLLVAAARAVVKKIETTSQT
jgi:sirohydrochlorin cobaltochelatase